MILKRRTVLTGMAFATIGLSSNLHAASRRQRVGVIGGGIIGASIAYQLAKAGAEVLLFERERPAAGATGKSLAWINPLVPDPHYMQVRLDSMKAWREDDRDLSINAVWGGSINWANRDIPDEAQRLQTEWDLLTAKGEAPRFLTAQQIRDETGVEPGHDVALALESTRDGHVDPIHATERYMAAAARLGARILYPCDVTGLAMKGTRVTGVQTSKGNFALDHIVTAAGTGTPRVLALVGKKLELKHRPALLVQTTPQPVVTQKVFEASGLYEFKQNADGRFATNPVEDPPNVPQHAGILDSEATYPTAELANWHGEMFIRRTAAFLPTLGNAQVEKVLLGFRPYPLDNRPVIGDVPGVEGLYTVVTHSGITLAPILGRHAAREILTGARVANLTPYRPNRFFRV